MAVTPTITFPTSSPGFSTNLKYQTIKGNADPTTKNILVNGSISSVSYTAGATGWTYTTTLNDGENVFSVLAVDNANVQSSVVTLTITYISESNLNLIITPPTGIVLERSKNSVKISIIQNPEQEVIGYNFYGSEEVGGGTQGFTLLNKTIITEPDFFKENNIILSETVDTVGDIKTTYLVEKIKRDYYYSYTHNRVNTPLGTKPLSEPNHYVATSVAFDTASLQQVESIYSAELGTSPLLLDTSIKDLPARTTVDIQQSYINSIQRSDNTIDVKPGTVTRDIYINPPSDEFERLYIIQNFQHRSQSFLTLIDFDDANGDGISDPVLEDVNKTRLKEALLISDENYQDVQQLIDDAFTKLAGNVNIKRKAAQKAIGQALFYTRKAPTKDSTINAGGIIETISDETTPSVQFTVLTDFTLPYSELSNYYNPLTERYEVLLDIQAVVEGEAGNVDAEKIQLVVSGIDSIFAVNNPNPTEFGQDLESNNDLAERAMLAFVSVDAGTEAGYLATTLGTPNVQRAKIISAGETLMQRDIDPLRLVHTFGKVDIYTQGSIPTSYTENFGFTYATVKKEKSLIQSVSNYQFKTTNTNITIDKPIFQLIEVKNVSKAANYDVTGAIILGDGDVFQIDKTLVTNQTIGLLPTDIILASYRYRDSEPYIFLNQPVDSILSVVGENSGTLTLNNYILQKLEDPLKFGNSTSSSDQMILLYANGVPNGGIIAIVDEAHLLFGENSVQLTRYGVDTDTILVTDSQNATIYQKDIDYTIIPGDLRTLTSIKRTTNSSIPSGTAVLVDYSAGENFSVTYTVNTLLQDVQTRIDTMRHLTADVVVKSSIVTYLDFDIKIVLEEGTEQTDADRKIRTAIAKFLNEKQIGQSVYQSDIIRIIEEANGVDHVVVPFTKMVRANGSIIIKESYTGEWVPYQTTNVTSYESVGKLSWETTDGGGSNSTFRGVFESDIDLVLVSRIADVSEAAGRAYISGDGHIYVSPRNGDINNINISVTYIVQNASGARDISFCDIEYGKVGTNVITYDFAPKFKGF